MTKQRSVIENTLIFALLASLLSLALAYAAQYGFGLRPCDLCLMQRVPYALIIAMALLGLWKNRYGQLLTLLIGLSFIAGGSIASYHAAVEKHWIKGPSACTDTETHAVQSLDEFLKKMQAAPVVACDQPQWELHGITMASLNALWSFGLGAATFIAMQQSRKKNGTHA